jgi:hypothetical protein
VSQSRYTKWDLLEKQERLQLEQCSGTGNWWFPAQVKAGAFMDVLTLGWGWGFFSLAVDSQAFLDELVCFPLIGGGGKQS